MDKIAKIIVVVSENNTSHYLMSIKKKIGKQGHGKLEFLGGHIDHEETPFEGLIRELKEEEISCYLAKKASKEKMIAFESEIDGALHFLFKLTISQSEFDRLEACEDESLGFELIYSEELFLKKFQNKLTKRTRKIIDVLNGDDYLKKQTC